MAQIKKFPFEQLKKVSRDSLLTKKTSHSADNVLLSSIKKRFSPESLLDFSKNSKKVLGTNLHLSLTACELLSFKEVLQYLQPNQVSLCLSTKTLSQKVFFIFPHALGFILVDSVLGGRGQAKPVLHTLTALEKGVLQYLSLKVIQNVSARYPEATLLFDKLEDEFVSLSNFYPDENAMAVLTLEIVLHEQKFLSYLLLPEPMVASWSQSGDAKKESITDEMLRRFGDSKIQAWAEIGNVSLSAAELSMMNVGDVLLLDEANATIENNELRGEAELRFQSEGVRPIQCQLIDAGGRLKLVLDSLV